jgi:L-ribulose-5-phosphate 3-epimerase
MKPWQSNLAAIPFGLYEKALPQELSWEKRLVQAREAGFDFMEMSVDDTDARLERLDWGQRERDEVRKAVANTAIPVRSLSLSAHRRYPLGNKSAKTRKTAMDVFYKAIDLALDLNLRYILLSGAENYYEEQDEESQALFLEGLGKGFERASSAGLMLALENWDHQIDSLTKVMRYVNYFNSPWFQAYADIGNLTYAQQDTFSELEAARGHIAALHVKDTLPGQLRYVTPGEGEVPFVEAFVKLAEMGFQAPVVLELWTESFPDALERVKAGFNFIKEIMAEGWRVAAEGRTLKDEKIQNE